MRPTRRSYQQAQQAKRESQAATPSQLAAPPLQAVAQAFGVIGAAAEVAASRPAVDGEHAGRFRHNGPGLLKVEIGGEVPRHVYPTKVFSVAERHFGEAFAAGLEWVGWAAMG